MLKHQQIYDIVAEAASLKKNDIMKGKEHVAIVVSCVCSLDREKLYKSLQATLRVKVRGYT